MTRKSSAQRDKATYGQPPRRPATLRIVGGTFRGRLLHYRGDPRTRPMKDRVREAVFNLIGPAIQGRHAIDLFAGTGALGLEALSRGAARATFVERHFPTAQLIEQNIQTLGVDDLAEVVSGDAFLWARHVVSGELPWVVFCSPPYDFYLQRCDDMLELIETMARKAPSQSMIVVESDRRFDPRRLPQADQWDVRHYPPAVLSLADLPLLPKQPSHLLQQMRQNQEESPHGREEHQ